ncbi:MAG: glycosyltransferase family 39 protein, partial [Bacillota bacterium]|nr:glycosyltransferase family 39 protein [Bacillota bacterium]
METNRKKNSLILAFLLLCSLCAAIFTAVSVQKYGPGITHDSAAYIYAAQSLLNGEGFQYFGYPSPFIQWPPLYPALLALGEWFGFGAGAASVVINSIAYALIVFIAGRWMLIRFKSSILAFGGTLLLLFSVPLLQVSKYVWTETLFVLFLLLFYMEFEQFLQHGGRRFFLLSALFAALACMERYAGVTIIAAACLFLLFTKKIFWKRLADAALFGALSALPMGI